MVSTDALILDAVRVDTPALDGSPERTTYRRSSGTKRGEARRRELLARVTDDLPLKLVVIDERVSLFTMEDPVAGAGDLTIMIVEHPGFAGLLKLAFEHVWEAGEDFR